MTFRLLFHSARFRLPCIRPVSTHQQFHPFLLTNNFSSTAYCCAKRTPTEPRDDGDGALKKFTSGLERFLDGSPTREQVEHQVRRKLDDFLPSTAERHIVYSTVISTLLRYKHVKPAAHVYERMHEHGYIPSLHTHAEMLSVLLAVSDPDPKTLTTLATVVKDPLYAEDRLFQLLETMENIGVSYEIMHQVSIMFIESRPTDYTPSQSLVRKLLDVKTRAGLVDDALQYLRDNENRPLSSSTKPFVSVLRALSETNPADEEGPKQTLLTMQETHVQPDINVFNALISRELRRRSLHNAFALYHAIIQFSKTSVLSPNPSTFGILFSALAKLFKPDIHLTRAPFHKSNAVPPRQLYRDLLFFHQRDSLQVTSALLNRALRSFLKTKDYAGAYVVLGSFKIFRIQVTPQTYHLIVDHLVRRILWDIKLGRAKGETRWGDRFLGIETEDLLHKARTWSFDQVFMQKFMASASGSEFHLTGYLLGEDFGGQQKHIIPTTTMMINRDTVLPSAVLSIVPLQRLLRRALAAAEEGSRTPDVSLASHVYNVVRLAKQDIFPSTEHPYGTV
jgi:pentatricopeptide repeat protein